MFILEELKFSSHCLKKQGPRLIKQLVLFKLGTHVAFVLFVVSCDLRLPLLEDFNFEASFSWPLLAQVFIKFFHRLVLKFLALGDSLLFVKLFVRLQPREASL